MKIAITGSSGFLGTALCAYLDHLGHDLTRLTSANCDLRRRDSLDAYSKEKFELIFHLAAWTQAGDFCLSHPGEQWIINQQINTNTLAWWTESHPKAKLIFMGTSCAYAPGSNLREAEYMSGEPTESLYTYAMTKRMLYQGARALNRQFGLRYLCTVPSTLYGSGYHTDGRQMHFIFDLIRKILRGREFGEPVVFWGDGYQTRELVHVGDFVHILWELAQDYENDIFNVGAGEEFSIRRFADLVCEIVGYPTERIIYDTSRYVGARSKCLNIEKLGTALGHCELMPLRIGLQDTIDWFHRTGAYR